MIKFNKRDVNKGYENGSLINKAYEGGRVIFQKLFIPEPPQPFSGKWLATYQNTHIESAECDASSAITAGEISDTIVSVKIGDCVTSIGHGAFFWYVSLTSIDIPNSVTSIGNSAFDTCIGLTSINIPNSVTSIGHSAFLGCSGLTSITINAIVPPTLGSSVFDNTNDCPIYVPCASVDAYKAALNWSAYSSRIEGIPPCGEPTFSGKWLATYDYGTFSGECNSISELAKNEIEYGHRVLSLEIGSCVTSIGRGAFANDFSGMTSCKLPDTITSIGISAFYACLSLTTINIPSGLTIINNRSFDYCRSITAITIPNSVQSIGERAFWGNRSLTEINIPDSVTTIGDSAFQKCSGATSLVIGSGCTSISSFAFNDCTSLQSITCLATAPPTLGTGVFLNTNCPIYVPSGSVSVYKSTIQWLEFSDRIQAIP